MTSLMTESLWLAEQLTGLGQKRKNRGKTKNKKSKKLKTCSLKVIISSCKEASTQESLDVVRKVVTEDGTMISTEQMLSVSGSRKEENGSDEASSLLTEPSAYTYAMLTRKCELLYGLGGMFETRDCQFILNDFYYFDYPQDEKKKNGRLEYRWIHKLKTAQRR